MVVILNFLTKSGRIQASDFPHFYYYNGVVNRFWENMWWCFLLCIYVLDWEIGLLRMVAYQSWRIYAKWRPWQCLNVHPFNNLNITRYRQNFSNDKPWRK